MNLTLIVVVVLLLQSTLFAQTRSPYLGFEYKGVIPGKTLSNGVKHLGGGMIGDINADPVYGISQVQKGTTKMLWFEVSTGQDATGVTGWKVLDVLTFSSLARTRYVFFVGDPAISCSRGRKTLENLVGEGRIIRSRGRFIPSNLWTANLRTKKFERVAVSGVTCEYSEP
jgi:hypothetical protein